MLMTTPATGIALMAVAMILLPAGDAIAKHLTALTAYGAGFLAWSRFVVGLALVAPAAAAGGQLRGLDAMFLVRQALRGGLVASAITCVINAVATAPLADVYGAFFVGPTAAIVLARLLLHEQVRPREWVAVLLGFVGVLLVVRPTGAVGPGLLWALGAGLSFGGFLVATRWAAGTAPPIAQLAGQLFFGFAFLLPLGIGDLLRFGIEAPGWLIAMALSSALANLLQLLAVRHTHAVVLAPVVYLQIVAATAFGWALFGDRPDGWTFAGLGVIMVAGLCRVPLRRRASDPSA
jgi:drug/metabolite transporter (DMT)-like permease